MLHPCSPSMYTCIQATSHPCSIYSNPSDKIYLFISRECEESRFFRHQKNVAFAFWKRRQKEGKVSLRGPLPLFITGRDLLVPVRLAERSSRPANCVRDRGRSCKVCKVCRVLLAKILFSPFSGYSTCWHLCYTVSTSLYIDSRDNPSCYQEQVSRNNVGIIR